MIHPIFMAVLRRPELLATHLANYSRLVKAEVTAVGTSLAVRAISAAIALVALLLALGISAIAVMLGFLHGSFHWILVIVPGVAWLIALIGTGRAMKATSVEQKVDAVKDEVDADFQMLKLVQKVRNHG